MKTLPEEKLNRLSPEKRALYEERLRKVKRNRRILAAFITVIIVGLIGAVLSMTVLFRISSINVSKPGKVYSTQEIISASGLNIGENMLVTKFDVAENRIEEMLPYVLDAKISKSLTGRIDITVTDDKAEIIFEAKNGFALADVNGKVLEIAKEKPEDSKYKILKTKQKTNAVPGKPFGFTDETEHNLYDTICKALNDAGIFKDISSIDISEITNIKIVYQNRMRIKIGTADDIEQKIKAAVKVIAEEDETNPGGIAEVNVKLTKKVFVKTLDTLEEPTEAEDTKDKPAEDTAGEENGSEQAESEEKTEAADENGESETDENSSEEEKTEENSETETSENDNNSEEEN